MKMAIFNLACYFFGCLWSVFFGLRGLPIISLIGVSFLISLQLTFTRKESEKLFIQDLILLPIPSFFGLFLEMIFIKTGALDYAGDHSIFPPLWMLILYPLFSQLINHSLLQVSGDMATTFILGFLGVPLSYIAGNIINGIAFPRSLFFTWIVLGTCWGYFLCFLKKVAKQIQIAADKTFEEKESKKPLKLFYDGSCPICSKEAYILQKDDQKNSMRFIDIASSDFLKENEGISYETAMSKMHAIDDKGNVLTGIDAFAKAYARSGKLLLSTLLNISFLRPFLKISYSVFAKHRKFLTWRS
ncbi:MAG TPA: DUF2878 family protein [Parachlamydiaceae bacterium]|nr:DUF2878 family protein [Parachlamydiaceae bacterium]